MSLAIVTPQQFLIAIAVVALIVMLVGCAVWLTRGGSDSVLARTLGPSDSSEPRVVINVPEGVKRPADLPQADLPEPPTTITGERAALWWTVFDRALSDSSCDTVSEAVDAANEAVEKVYGREPR